MENVTGLSLVSFIIYFLHFGFITSMPVERDLLFPDEFERLIAEIKCRDYNICPNNNIRLSNGCRSSTESTASFRSLNPLECDSMKGQYLWTPDFKCYTILQQGPCNENEWLVLDYEDNLVCKPRKCDNCQLRTKRSAIKCQKSMLPFRNEYGDLECECKIGEVFHPQTKKCYPNYSRGPCAEGFVIRVTDIGDKGYGICQINECPNENMATLNEPCKSDVLRQGPSGCYFMNTQGPCEDGQFFNANNVLAEPSCVQITNFALITNCSRGSRRDLAGRCRRKRRDVGQNFQRERPQFTNSNVIKPGNFSSGKCPEDYIFLAGNCFQI